MRIVFSFLLLVTFTLRPVMEMAPFFYYQLNLDYIIENYCVNKERPRLQCNGKCYLMSKLKEKNTSDNKATSFRISESFLPLYFQKQDIDIENNIITSGERMVFTSYSFTYNFLYTNTIEHPPEFI
ncbi:hypothetical protein [Aquimarina aquimarini]|uniref:hypothetical protein n=1 Tax=Aquimarina aquimarini TaxID=1191734 RepID=UPI00131F465D|nr:hypothetical protein [Aquimarina aquimarini]